MPLKPVQLTVREIKRHISPLAIFSILQSKSSYAYLLESVEGPRKLAKFSFVGFDPGIVVESNRDTVTVTDLKNSVESTRETTDPLECVREIAQRKRVQRDLFRLTGGAVGYISYDAVRYWERLPGSAEVELVFPQIHMAVFDEGIVFDHEQGKTYYYTVHDDHSEEVQSHIEELNVEKIGLEHDDPRCNISKEDFQQSVSKAKEYISSGDIFQVVLSKRYDFHVEGDLLDFYGILRRINPSPYMYFLKMGDVRIVGSSPEMLVRVVDDAVETYPIAGTRPRVDDPNRNRALAEELLHDPKERAEHVMLVDLARNDIGKISQLGSVRVPEFMTVHEYSHVQHIVSHVVGRLSRNSDSFDALKAMLPAGTVSGAPKVRAMEIIDELEPSRRGPYAGAVGYFSYNGNADFAITIRTLFANMNRAHIQVGAGIVADSVPEREWYETEYKAQALFRSLHLAAGDEIDESSVDRQL